MTTTGIRTTRADWKIRILKTEEFADRRAIHVHAVATYDPAGSAPFESRVVFTGPSLGMGPVTYNLPAHNFMVTVDDPGRFGDVFDVAWVQRFYGPQGD